MRTAPAVVDSPNPSKTGAVLVDIAAPRYRHPTESSVASHLHEAFCDRQRHENAHGKNQEPRRGTDIGKEDAKAQPEGHEGGQHEDVEYRHPLQIKRVREGRDAICEKHQYSSAADARGYSKTEESPDWRDHQYDVERQRAAGQRPLPLRPVMAVERKIAKVIYQIRRGRQNSQGDETDDARGPSLDAVDIAADQEAEQK